MGNRWWFLPALLLAVAVALGGCGGGRNSGTSRSLEVTAMVQSGGQVVIVAAVTGVTLGQDSHLHLSLDGGPEVMVLTPPFHRYQFQRLSPGTHKVRVWITDQRHNPINLEKTVEFTVE